MADVDDLRRIAMALPDTMVDPSGTRVAVSARGGHRPIAWSFDGLGPPGWADSGEQGVLAVRVADAARVQSFVTANPGAYAEVPGAGAPAVLVRVAMISAGELERLLFDAWRCEAPKQALARYDKLHGGR